ncbi:hypothetical protein BU23DRAFT_470944, partial [Bimuria novae-zelandiae CBS 107.79]
TLVLGKTPSPLTGDMAVYSGVTLDNGDLLQGTSMSAKLEDNFWCRYPSPTQWCNMAYVFRQKPQDHLHPSQQWDKTVAASPGQSVRAHYKLNEVTRLWDQNVYIDGKLVSTLSTSIDERGRHFSLVLECAIGKCAAVPAHGWQDVSVVLNSADLSFKHSSSWGQGVTGGVMTTPDDGKTWNLTSLSMPETQLPHHIEQALTSFQVYGEG